VCEEAVGELCNAWQHFQEVIHALAADDDRVGIANQHLQQLEPRLPRLTVHRSVDSPDDTHALIGGVALGAASFDVALPMDPGKYTVEAAADGRATRSYPIELHEGDQLELQLEPGGPLPPVAATAHDTSGVSSPAMQSPGPAAAAPADMGSRPASGPSARRLVAYTLLGASGVSLITAAISAGLMLDRQATVDANCVSSACNPQGWAALQEFRTFRVLGISALSVGVATGGTALFLLLTEPRAHNPKIAIQPVLAPTAIGLRFRAAL
jgi:hypothetical protein